MGIKVERVEFPKDAVRFCKVWWPIYREDPNWVPPLLFERKAFFDPAKNPYFNVAKIACFIASENGVPLGTIGASVDKTLQETEPGVGMFGFFEFADREDVARALFDAAADFLRSEGMQVARGPFNFSPNHEFGLLIDGFDTPPTLLNPHNRPYYEAMYDKLGMHKAKDWYAYWIDAHAVPERIGRIATRFMERNPKLTIRALDMKNYEEEVERFLGIYNDAWEHNWGHIRFTEEEFRFTAKGLKDVIDPDLCYFAFIDDEVAAASITFPDYNQAVKKMNGRLFPFGWWHWLNAKRTIDQFRVFVLGVRQKYQRLPLGAPLYLKTWEEANRRGVRGGEASLILEDNHRMRGALEKLGGSIYKTYRSYEVDL